MSRVRRFIFDLEYYQVELLRELKIFQHLLVLIIFKFFLFKIYIHP
jgi:hypothetical protein